jgi:hypothetical protein
MFQILARSLYRPGRGPGLPAGCGNAAQEEGAGLAPPAHVLSRERLVEARERAAERGSRHAEETGDLLRGEGAPGTEDPAQGSPYGKEVLRLEREDPSRRAMGRGGKGDSLERERGGPAKEKDGVAARRRARWPRQGEERPGEPLVAPARPERPESGGRRRGTRGREENQPEERDACSDAGTAEERDAPRPRRRRNAGKERLERAPFFESFESAGRGASARDQDPVELRETTLRRDPVKAPGRAAQLGERHGVEAKARKAREETGGADDAERVLEEDAGAREPQAARVEVVEGPGGSHETAAGKGEAERVDAEVAAKEVVGGVAVGLPDVDGRRAERDVEDPAGSLADGQDARAAEARERLGETGRSRAGDGEVEVPRRETEERVAHRAPDEEERDAGETRRFACEPDDAATGEAPEGLALRGESVHGWAGR